MLTFGLVGEGPTDQAVIENILLGYFQGQERELDIRHLEPPRPLTETPGGWGHVFKWLERGRYEEALQFVQYLVIQIDADKQEDYGVPRYDGGRELCVAERVEGVTARLRKDIDAAFYRAKGDRILFAIAVDSIECWLLPLLYDDNHAEKTTGCEKAANIALGKADRKRLSAGGEKFFRAYEEASSGYRKRKTLMKHRVENPSLKLFIEQLDALQGRLTADPPAGSEKSDNAAPADEETPGN